MEVNGFTNENVILRINLSAYQARENINKTQNSNFTPILALSYYEYPLFFGGLPVQLFAIQAS